MKLIKVRCKDAKKRYTVEISGGSVGEVFSENVKIGDRVTIKLKNVNGIPIERTGRVLSILEENSY